MKKLINFQRSDVQNLLRRLNGMIVRNGGRGFLN